MARYYDAANTFQEPLTEPGVTTILYCRLFKDMVSDSVCMMRSRVLTSGGTFSCKGCIMNIAFDRRVC